MERKDDSYQDSVRILHLPTILRVCAQRMHSEPEPVLICFSISVINMNQKQVGEEKVYFVPQVWKNLEAGTETEVC